MNFAWSIWVIEGWINNYIHDNSLFRLNFILYKPNLYFISLHMQCWIQSNDIVEKVWSQ